MRRDAYDFARTSTTGPSEGKYHDMAFDDSHLANELKGVRKQATGATAIVEDMEFMDRLVSKSSLVGKCPTDLIPSEGKYLLSEGLQGTAFEQVSYYQDPHNDWGVVDKNWTAYMTNSAVPSSVIASLEPGGSAVRVWKGCRGESPTIHSYKDVHIPARALLVIRGDVVHSGLGYMLKNVRYFRYFGVKDFPMGEDPFENEVQYDKDFVLNCRDQLAPRLPWS
jgi:hypothetical protein